MFCLLEERYQAALGEMVLKLNADANQATIEQQDNATRILTAGHEVLIRRVRLPLAWLPDWRPTGLNIASAAWGFYIRKRNAAAEQLNFTIGLGSPDAATETDAVTGQWLTAIEFANATHQVHIGTQDEDKLAWEAEADKWVPRRLQEALASYRLTVTTVEPYQLTTQVPQLRENEQFYFHYILAESPRCKSAEYPQEWDLSTWYCVDQTREKMEEAWQQRSAIKNPADGE